MAGVMFKLCYIFIKNYKKPLIIDQQALLKEMCNVHFSCVNKAYFITLSTSEEGGEHADTSQKRRVI